MDNVRAGCHRVNKVQDWSATVVVPTYNHEKQIIEAMNSIVRQDIFAEVKVLVSDDGSSDRTYPIACWYQNQYENIEVTQNPVNLGVLGNYASLTRRCQTEFIAVLEGDDVWIATDKLRRQIEFLRENPGLDACFTEFLCLEERTGKLFGRPAWADGRYKTLSMLDLLYENSPATFSTCCYRSEVLNEVICRIQGSSGFDWLTNLLVAESGGFGFVPKPSAVYRLSPHGLWTGSNEADKRRLRVETLKKAQELLVCDKYACYFQDHLEQILSENDN